MTGFTTAQTADLERFSIWLDAALERGAVAVLAGQNGDMDTVGSAVALASYHSNLMACGVHVGRLAGRLLAQHQAPFRRLKQGHAAWPTKLGGVIVVDAAAPDQTGVQLPDAPICVLDHHATDGWELRERDCSLKWDVRSTTTMVAGFLLTHRPSVLTPQVCEFLLAGLVTDTGRFRHANAQSFRIASDLIATGSLDYAAFLEQLESEHMSSSDRGAVLRGLQRAEMTEAGPWSVIRTSAGTLEGRVASTLNSLGSDAVVVVRHRNGETRMTGRSPRASVLKGVHLGNVMERVAEQIGGHGGGHNGAAGWSGPNDPVEAESAFLNALAQLEPRVMHDDDD